MLFLARLAPLGTLTDDAGGAVGKLVEEAPGVAGHPAEGDVDAVVAQVLDEPLGAGEVLRGTSFPVTIQYVVDEAVISDDLDGFSAQAKALEPETDGGHFGLVNEVDVHRHGMNISL